MSLWNWPEKYSTGKTSDSIGELILRMYKFASGQIEPEKWIKEAISVYDVHLKKKWSSPSGCRDIWNCRKTG